MKEAKKSGSYYTPVELIRFMISYLEKEQRDFSSVLEPSAGDGRFIPLLLPKAEHIEAIELFEEKVMQICLSFNESKVEVKKRNFSLFGKVFPLFIFQILVYIHTFLNFSSNLDNCI